MWAALKSPLLLGNDLRKMTPTTLSIINNPAIIAISQDPRGKSVQRVARNTSVPQDSYGIGETHIWSGPLDNGDQIVIFLNVADTDLEITTTLEEIFVMNGVGGTAPQVHQDWAIHDLWSEGHSRMPKADAEAILSASAGKRQQMLKDLKVYNATQMSYKEGLEKNDPRLFGERIGVVKANGSVGYLVPRHAAKVLRLRGLKGSDGEREFLVKQEL